MTSGLAVLCFVGAGGALVLGCSGGGSSDSAPATPSDPTAALEAQYQADLKEVSDGFDACVAAGACNDQGVIPAGAAKNPRVVGPVLHPQGLLSAAGSLVNAVPSTFCKLAAGLTSQDLNNLWWFMGNSLSGSFAVKGISGGPVGGMDLAYDFWNKQGAGFAYVGGAIAPGSGFGGTASAYEGFASGSKMGVIDGWSGTFVSGNVSVSSAVLKFIGAGATLTFFCDPEKTICGAGIGADLSVSSKIAIGLPVSASASISVAQWYPFDTLTADLSQSPWFGWGFSASLQGPAGGQYVQFNDGKSLAYGILGSAGISSPIAVALAVGVAALRASGGTVDSLCKTADGGVSEAGTARLVGP